MGKTFGIVEHVAMKNTNKAYKAKIKEAEQNRAKQELKQINLFMLKKQAW